MLFFWFATIHPKWMSKILFLIQKFTSFPQKEVVALLLSWNTLYRAISKCIVSWFQLFGFYSPLFTQKSTSLFLKFKVLRERSSGIASFVEHHVYTNRGGLQWVDVSDIGEYRLTGFYTLLRQCVKLFFSQ